MSSWVAPSYGVVGYGKRFGAEYYVSLQRKRLYKAYINAETFSK